MPRTKLRITSLLMDIKTDWNREIATYQCLLEGSESEPNFSSVMSSKWIVEPSVRRVKTVIEELVDGKVCHPCGGGGAPTLNNAAFPIAVLAAQ
ncbi:hypothetical protein E2320_002734 [Naja naja]|nr:hypothetical protein E2320_002734 [Naja naja]